MYQIGVIAALLVLPLQGAPSFDCEKARLRVEKIICGDTKLEELDELLSQTYADNLKTHKNLRLTQKRWLKQRNRCKDNKCPRKAYTERINTIDPFADKNITCEKMRRYKQKIFSNDDIDLGSGSFSPIEFDYYCKESLASQPFLSTLLQIAKSIRGNNPRPECSGTITSALSRYYHYRLTKAGFVPTQNPGSISKDLEKYFHHWSLKSLSNFERHQEYLAQLQKAKIKLAEYYKKKFKLPLAKAKRTAQTNLRIITDWAAGSFPSKELEEPSKLVKLAADSKSTTADVRKLLVQLAKDPTKKKQAYDALKVSLLLDKPRAHQELLIAHIGNLGAKDLERGEESEIFFALKNRDNVEYLLSQGALVDYPNTFGKTALFYAIESNNHELVKLLLARGANVNHAYKTQKELLNTEGYQPCDLNIEHTKRTPLMHAAQHSDNEMLKLLIDHKARLHDVDELGFNALDYAVMANKEKSQEFLKTCGLKPKSAPVKQP